jgi:hypothetical protein
VRESTKLIKYFDKRQVDSITPARFVVHIFFKKDRDSYSVRATENILIGAASIPQSTFAVPPFFPKRYPWPFVVIPTKRSRFVLCTDHGKKCHTILEGFVRAKIDISDY